MIIVIVGAKGRDTEEDRLLVEELIEKAADKYGPGCIFTTVITMAGVGKFVKLKCLEKDSRDQFRFQLLEWNLKLYVRKLTKAEASTVYLSRNATLAELGDLFFYFACDDRMGTLEDLIENRVRPSGRPFKIFLPGDKIELP